MSDVVWLGDVSRENKDAVGEKAAYLGELIGAGLPVPRGFVVTTDAYKEAFSEIQPEVSRILESVNAGDIRALNQAAVRIRELFVRLELPTDIKREVSNAYDKMASMPEEYKNVNKIALDFIRAGRDRPFLMVRSSSTLDAPSQQAFSTDVNGTEDMLKKVKMCWASLFTPRAIYYRKVRNLPEPAIAVIIQERPNLLKSGNVFSVNPLTNSKSQLLIQARWGFTKRDSDEAHIIIYDKQSKQVEHSDAPQQKSLYIFDPQVMKVAKRDVSEELKGLNILSQKEIELIDNLARKVTSVFKFPQDIEWGIAKGKFYVLQSRPITSVFKKPIIASNSEKRPVLEGTPASEGAVSGQVTFTPAVGKILLSKGLSSNVFQSILGSKGLVVEKSDLKSLPAVIARELGIPCVIRAKDATRVFKEGQEIEIDGSSGSIFAEAPKIEPSPWVESSAPESHEQHVQELASMMSNSVAGTSPISIVLDKVSDLEATLTELVLQEAQKRRESPHEVNDGESKMISELEWEVRALREKIETLANGHQSSEESNQL